MALKRKNGTKNEILQQHSALNCRPGDVRDELFLEYEFFDAFDTVQIKYEMLRRVQKDGWPVSRAAKVFGFSRNAFYKARIAFQKAGIAGLFRERPGPRHAHKLSEEVMDFIKQALKENGLMHDYLERPAYQQNDYIGWINHAKLETTKLKRLAQMLDELEQGGIYMKMDHPASRKNC